MIVGFLERVICAVTFHEYRKWGAPAGMKRCRYCGKTRRA